MHGMSCLGDGLALAAALPALTARLRLGPVVWSWAIEG